MDSPLALFQGRNPVSIPPCDVESLGQGPGAVEPEDGVASVALMSRSVHLAPLVVLIDGLGRTGKSLLGPLLSGLERVEIERMEELLEHVGVLWSLGKISNDAAIALLRIKTDAYLYNSILGRNVNFRLADHSSAWRSSNLVTYLRRLFSSSSEDVPQRIRVERPIFQTMTHDQLPHFWLFDRAFGERLRFVEVLRHPVDLVASWQSRGWGSRFGTDPCALTLCIRHSGRDLPYYARGWEQTYVEAGDLDRIIRMIESSWRGSYPILRTLSRGGSGQILPVFYEDFLRKPFEHACAAANFLGTQPSAHLSRALRRVRRNNLAAAGVRAQKRAKLESECGPAEREILDRMIEEFEELHEALAEGRTCPG